MSPNTSHAVHGVGVAPAGTTGSVMQGQTTQEVSQTLGVDSSKVYKSVFSSPMWTVLIVVVVFSLVGYFVLKVWADYYVKKKTDRLLAQFREEEGLSSTSDGDDGAEGSQEDGNE